MGQAIGAGPWVGPKEPAHGPGPKEPAHGPGHRSQAIGAGPWAGPEPDPGPVHIGAGPWAGPLEPAGPQAGQPALVNPVRIGGLGCLVYHAYQPSLKMKSA